MSTAISYVIDVVMLVFVLMFSVVNLPMLSQEWATPILSEIEDKSVLTTENSIYVSETIYDGSDLLMSLVALDTNVPFPRSIRINDSPIIDITDGWLTSKSEHIAEIYNVSGSYKLGSMLDYRVESVTYVNNSNDPYWQYELVEVAP